MYCKAIPNYKYFLTKNKVIAVSTFAGKTVRGVAICSDHDEFDLNKGKHLAAARCNEKVAKKRLARATQKKKEAQEAAKVAFDRLAAMERYESDAYVAYNSAAQLVDKLIKTY